MSGIKCPILSVNLKDYGIKILPKFMLVVTGFSEVNKTKYCVSQSRLIITLRGRITEDKFL